MPLNRGKLHMWRVWRPPAGTLLDEGVVSERVVLWNECTVFGGVDHCVAGRTEQEQIPA